MKKKQQAFTLVELLVVVVIIGILAAIALPVFQKAQEKARAISDASNLRQLGIAIQAYKGDNSGDLPSGLTATTDPKSWPQQLNPTYISTWKIFKSPFDSASSTRIFTEDNTSAISYGINDEAPVGNSGKLLGLDSSKINFPSNLILIGPAIDTSSSSVKFVANIGTTEAKITAPAIADMGTHSSRKRVNVLYADGHTEDILWTKFMDKASTDGLKRWVYDTP